MFIMPQNHIFRCKITKKMLNCASIFAKKLLIPLSKCKFCGILFDNLPQKSTCGGQAVSEDIFLCERGKGYHIKK